MDAYTIARYTIADLYLDEDGKPLAGCAELFDEAVDAALAACQDAGISMDEAYTWAVQAAELLLLSDEMR